MTLFRNAENRSKHPTSFFFVGNLISVIFFDRFIVRDFVYSEQEIAKQENDLQETNVTEKELWVFVENFLSIFLLLIRYFLDGATKAGSH
jgi:hypothetical protein